MHTHVMMFSGNAETLNKAFTIIIDNRRGSLTTSVKKLLSAAEVGVCCCWCWCCFSVSSQWCFSL